MIRRATLDDVPALNAITNHPDVLPHVSMAGQGELDLTGIVANPANVVLMADGGALILLALSSDVYEGHMHFLPEARGEAALAAARQALAYVFAMPKTMMVIGCTPIGNKPALAFAKALGFVADRIIDEPTGLYTAARYPARCSYLTKAMWLEGGRWV